MKWTEEMKEWLREYVPGHSRKEITAEFNKRFDADLNEGAIASRYKHFGFKTGHTGYFPKGIVTNKGKKQSEYMSLEAIERTKPTRFQKGYCPHNHRPIGSERIDNQQGYTWVKVAEPNKWRHKHILLWEEHNGPIPKDKVIIFLDGVKSNIAIENLMMIDRKVLARMNQKKLFSEDKDLTYTGVQLAKLIIAMKEAERKHNE